ncbi:MAG TPA: metalloregulator ArsR/SmtB family transcription factor [Gemmatimonadaceae bacterium]|jgi:DNA-binding transcriptional ArsR family regulator
MPRARAHTDTFAAIADPTRRAILDRLRRGSAPAMELAAGFRISRPAVSKHLRVLRNAHLVTERREGRNRVYQLTPGPLHDIDAWIESYRVLWTHNLSNLKRHLERKAHP